MALEIIRSERCQIERILQHADAVKAHFTAWESSFFSGVSMNYHLSSTLQRAGANLIRQNKFETTFSGLASELGGLEASLEMTEKTCSSGSGSCSTAIDQITAMYDRIKSSACPVGQSNRPLIGMGFVQGSCSPTDCTECRTRLSEATRFRLSEFRHPTCHGYEVRNAISDLNGLLWQNSSITANACYDNNNPRLCSQIQTSFTENDVILFMRDVQKLPCAQVQSSPASAAPTTPVRTSKQSGVD